MAWVRSLVETLYGFENGSAKKILKHNRELAENLKDNYAYIYAVSSSIVIELIADSHVSRPVDIGSCIQDSGGSSQGHLPASGNSESNQCHVVRE